MRAVLTSCLIAVVANGVGGMVYDLTGHFRAAVEAGAAAFCFCVFLDVLAWDK